MKVQEVAARMCEQQWIKYIKEFQKNSVLDNITEITREALEFPAIIFPCDVNRI